MNIGIILASSQIKKVDLIYSATKKYAKESNVINFGCFESENNYSYVDISIEIGLLLASGTVDFVITGCSSGQGMMLACNNMPGVICGYVPTPMDAYLFAQIIKGNAVSLPLGESYTYSGEDNCIKTIEKLFSEPFGQGFPKQEAQRKLRDAYLLRSIKEESQIDICTLLDNIDKDVITKVLSRKNVTEYILNNGTNKLIIEYIKKNIN